jgi:hypothetical protein
MPIPKVIYQTWKTKHLHENVQKIRDNIQALNPEYTMELYDDHEMETFIRINFSPFIYDCYKQLNVGAAKADFWRYCVLYIHGGVYLDMDSEITRPLDELISPTDTCIITREGNPGVFNNWFMIFEKRHPILLKTIQKCCHNIVHKTTYDVCYLTGPAGPFTFAVNDVMLPIYNQAGNDISTLYIENDDDLNAVLNDPSSEVRCKFYGIDMGTFGKWKHQYCDYLYQGQTYWRNETKIFNS